MEAGIRMIPRLEDFVDVLQKRARRFGHVVALSVGGALLVGGSAMLALTLIGNSSPAAATAVQVALSSAQTEAESAESELATARAGLMDTLGVNTARVADDTSTLESSVEALATAATSTLPIPERAAVLVAQHPFLAPVTGLDLDTDADRYEVGTLDLEVTGITGLDYSYLAVVGLTPIDVRQTADMPAPDPVWLVLRASTNSNGEVTSFEAHRVSNSTAELLNA